MHLQKNIINDLSNKDIFFYKKGDIKNCIKYSNELQLNYMSSNI